MIYALGVGSGVEDPNVAATLLRHGNYDYVTNSVMWDPGIPITTFPLHCTAVERRNGGARRHPGLRSVRM